MGAYRALLVAYRALLTFIYTCDMSDIVLGTQCVLVSVVLIKESPAMTH